jgi:hypothetical protein
MTKHIVSNETFLKTIFGTDWQRAWVCGFACAPEDDTQPARWRGARWRDRAKGLDNGDWNNYFAVSLFGEDKTGRVHRQEALVERIGALVCDDVGTGGGGKIEPRAWNRKIKEVLGPGVEPTWILETSPGNYHFGYVVRRADRSVSLELSALWGALTSSMTEDGRDPGNAGVTRYMRLPVGSNTKGGKTFRCRLVHWNPDAALDADGVLALLKMKATTGAGRDWASVNVASHDEAKDDPTGWGAALEKRGLLRGSRKAGVWDMECPFVAEHTGGRDDGCAYLGDGCFKCWHGHCEGRNVREFREELEKQHAGIMDDVRAGVWDDVSDEDLEDIEEIEQERASTFSLTEAGVAVSNYVFIEDADRFWDRGARILVTRQVVEDKLDKWRDAIAAAAGWVKGPKPTVVRALLRAELCKSCHSMTMVPGKREFLRDGRYNVWRDCGVGLGLTGADLVGVSAQETLTAFRSLASQLTGEDWMTELLLDWCALLVGAQGTKPAWQWLIISRQELGKGTFGEVLGAALGGDYTTLNGATFRGTFTDWLTKRLVVVDELIADRGNGRSSGGSLYDVMKPYLARGGVVRINPKYAKDFDGVSVTGFWMASNHAIPLLIEEDDRRLMIVDRTRGRDEIGSAGGGWDDVQKVLRRAGASDVIGRWLRDRWTGMDARRRSAVTSMRPPMTDAKKALGTASLSPMHGLIRDMMEDDLGHGPIWTKPQIERLLETRGLRVPYRRFVHEMRGMGAWCPVDHPKGQIRLEGKKTVVWALFADTSRGILGSQTLHPRVIRRIMADQAAARGGENVYSAGGDGEGIREGSHDGIPEK